MISYELAKQLKDAVFPQTYGEYGRYIRLDGSIDGIQENSDNSCYIPTLAELIEACGNKIDSLNRVVAGWKVGGSVETHDSEHPWIREEAVGATLEEAVARLWLALQGSV